MNLARWRTTPAYRAQAHALIDAGLDWSLVRKIAQRNNVASLLGAAIETLGRSDLPSDLMRSLTQDRRSIRMMSLSLVLRQIAVIEKILKPRSVRFAVLKGACLSKRYYGDELARQSRDIDLLIDASKMEDVISVLIGESWKIVNPSWRGHPVSPFVRYSSVVELQSPEGTRIELHKTLDNSGVVFDADAMLARTELVDVLGRSLHGLSRLDEFLYVCFHHSRHGWGCLHWCADLPAMMDAPDFSGSVLEPALAHPMMGRTVAEVVKLRANLDGIAAGQHPEELSERSLFLDMCLRSVDLEEEPPPPDPGRNPSDMEPDFVFAWQKTRRYMIRYSVSRCRPNLNDYDAWPLGDTLQWVYWLTRPWRALARRMRSQRAPPLVKNLPSTR